MEKTFKEKVQAMSAKEIIMAMVEGLRNPYVKVDMGTYGGIENGVCFGCAATNTICHIAGKVFTPEMIDNEVLRSWFLDVKVHFLDDFESAIDALRQGEIQEYNIFWASGIGLAKIKPIEGLILPCLHSIYTPEELEAYVQLANAQD